MIAALMLATCLILQPADQEQTELQERVQQLLRQLDSRELAEREEAEKQLVSLGADILPLLPEANNRMAAEMRQRLARIRNALEQVAAVSTVEATHVTLEGEMPIAEALASITAQTGNQIIGAENSDANITAKFQNVPFWVALDQLLDQSMLDTDPFGGRPNTLVLTPRRPDQAPRAAHAFYDGPFRVDALRIFSVRDLRSPQLSGMRVTTSLAWEPRLSPIAVSHAFASASATDEMGNPIPGMEQGVREATIQPGMTGIDFEIPFQLSDRSVTTIASLRGEFVVLVPGETEAFAFEGNLRAGMQQKRAGVTVMLDAVRKNVDVHQIALRVRFDNADGALESHRTWILANEAYLLDPNGERVENAGYESTGRRENEVGVAYLFALPEGQNDLRGYKFVYESPTTIIRQTVAYELKDLPLP